MPSACKLSLFVGVRHSNNCNCYVFVTDKHIHVIAHSQRSTHFNQSDQEKRYQQTNFITA